MTEDEILEQAYKEEPKTFDGKIAYDVLNSCPECPIQLPRARSMTQAKIDYKTRRDDIVKWYNQQKQ